MKLVINYINDPGITHEDDWLHIFDTKTGKGFAIKKNVLKDIVDSELK